ncbi:hypothetical protein JG688_00016333, partial [Phytophthora aleatoria]
WKHVVCEPSVLILDSLSVHKKAEIADALACTDTSVVYVPGGRIGVAQPLDVGAMAALKQHIRRLNTRRSPGRPKNVSPQFRRRAIFEAAMDGLRCVSADTIQNAFVTAGPFVPFGPPNNTGILPATSSDGATTYSTLHFRRSHLVDR